MSSTEVLLSACQAEPDTLLAQTRARIALWERWLSPLPGASATGDDPGYDDDFQLMREEVNKLSGASTEQACEFAERLLTTTAKDIRMGRITAGRSCIRSGLGAGAAV